MKKTLVILSVLLNVGFAGWVVFDDVLEMEVDDYFGNEGDSDNADMKELEEKYGVSQKLIENTAESIEECGQSFPCMMAVQFVYYNSFISSLNEYEGDVFACKSVNWQITILTVEDETNDVFSCVKMAKKYKGIGVEALQSDIEDSENYEKVVIK